MVTWCNHKRELTTGSKYGRLVHRGTTPDGWVLQTQKNSWVMTITSKPRRLQSCSRDKAWNVFMGIKLLGTANATVADDGQLNTSHKVPKLGPKKIRCWADQVIAPTAMFLPSPIRGAVQVLNAAVWKCHVTATANQSHPSIHPPIHRFNRSQYPDL